MALQIFFLNFCAFTRCLVNVKNIGIKLPKNLPHKCSHFENFCLTKNHFFANPFLFVRLSMLTLTEFICQFEIKLNACDFLYRFSTSKKLDFLSCQFQCYALPKQIIFNIQYPKLASFFLLFCLAFFLLLVNWHFNNTNWMKCDLNAFMYEEHAITM